VIGSNDGPGRAATVNKDAILREHLRKLGKKGGEVKSAEKLTTAKANLEKARAARWPKKGGRS